MHAIIFLVVVSMLVFTYHYERNGDPWAWGQLASRLIWALSMSVAYTAVFFPSVSLVACVLMFGTGYAGLMVPHAFAQRAGRRTDLWTDLPNSKWWPAFWMRPFLPSLSFASQDFIGMMSTGMLRGLIVFAPMVVLGYPLINALVGIFITAFWQPISYAVGYWIPFGLPHTTPNSSEWGEFLVGIGWAVALVFFAWA